MSGISVKSGISCANDKKLNRKENIIVKIKICRLYFITIGASNFYYGFKKIIDFCNGLFWKQLFYLLVANLIPLFSFF